MRSTETQRIRTATKFVSPSVGHCESALRSSATKTSQLIVLQPLRMALTITDETLALSISGEKFTVVSWQHSVTRCRPTYVPGLCLWCSKIVLMTQNIFYHSFYFPQKARWWKESCSQWAGDFFWPILKRVKLQPFNRHTWSFCTTSSEPTTSALYTGVQFPNAFSDPNIQALECTVYTEVHSIECTLITLNVH